MFCLRALRAFLITPKKLLKWQSVMISREIFINFECRLEISLDILGNVLFLYLKALDILLFFLSFNVVMVALLIMNGMQILILDLWSLMHALTIPFFGVLEIGILVLLTRFSSNLERVLNVRVFTVMSHNNTSVDKTLRIFHVDFPTSVSIRRWRSHEEERPTLRKRNRSSQKMNIKQGLDECINDSNITSWAVNTCWIRSEVKVLRIEDYSYPWRIRLSRKVLKAPKKKWNIYFFVLISILRVDKKLRLFKRRISKWLKFCNEFWRKRWKHVSFLISALFNYFISNTQRILQLIPTATNWPSSERILINAKWLSVWSWDHKSDKSLLLTTLTSDSVSSLSITWLKEFLN